MSDHEEIEGEITSATALRINSGDPYLKAYKPDDQGNIQIITGHAKGSIYLWEIGEEM